MSEENLNIYELMNKLAQTAQERALTAEEVALFNSHNSGLGALLGIEFTAVSKDEVRAQLEVKP
ncbi:MAG: PaaI family thioesterase, partial [Corynebacterium striatum]|nr:PaaI family thioesterase [Corynebacterium striatum]